jgi:hypothetical protein
MFGMDDRQAYRKKAQEMGIPEPVAEWLLGLALPRVTFHVQEQFPGQEQSSTQEQQEAGADRVVGHLGGNPWLPEDVEWSGFPHFIASIDCAALPRGAVEFPFPEDGRMLFFADANTPDFEPRGQDAYARVVYVPAGTPTAERVPEYVEDQPFLAEPVPLGYELHWTLPGFSSRAYEVLTEDARILYDKYDGDELGNEPWGYNAPLALGGHALMVQGDPLMLFLPDDFPGSTSPIVTQQRVAEAAAARPDDFPLPPHFPVSDPDPEGWLLLAEMRADLGWGVSPSITYWMIRRADLAERRFDRVKHNAQILE